MQLWLGDKLGNPRRTYKFFNGSIWQQSELYKFLLQNGFNSEVCEEEENFQSKLPINFLRSANIPPCSLLLVKDLNCNRNIWAKGAIKSIGLDPILYPLQSPSRWSLGFEGTQQKTIKLWQTCNISLVHRTYIFLPFKDDPRDSISIEEKYKMLSFLEHFVPKKSW